jgi:hypothetical protein
MPYPNQYIRGVTNSDTRLEPRQGEAPGGNSLGGDFVGNAHTFRVTSHDAGQVGAVQPPYDYDWTSVKFNGTDTYLVNATNMGLSAVNIRIVACVRFFIDALPSSTQTLIGHTTGGAPISLISITSTGAIRCEIFPNFSNNGFVGETVSGVIATKQWNTVHLFAVQGVETFSVFTDGSGIEVVGDSGNANTRRVFLSVNSVNAYMNGVPGLGFGGSVLASQWPGNGVLVGQSWLSSAAQRGWFSGASMTNFPVPTAWSVGGTPTGSQLFAGRMSLAWMRWGWSTGTAENNITNPEQFNPIRPMGTQLANPGVRPHIGFGVAQTLADWNAGTNLGSGTGSFTRNGAALTAG